MVVAVGIWGWIVAGHSEEEMCEKSPIYLIPYRMSDSTLWKDLMKVKHIYLQGREYRVGNRKSTSFWLDTWLGEKPLCLRYPYLYDLSSKQKCSVHEVAMNIWNVDFRIRLHGELRDQCMSWHQGLMGWC
jgi:hypothetical protein